MAWSRVNEEIAFEQLIGRKHLEVRSRGYQNSSERCANEGDTRRSQCTLWMGHLIASEMGVERPVCSEQEPQGSGTIAFTCRVSMAETDLWFLEDRATRLPVQFSLNFWMSNALKWKHTGPKKCSFANDFLLKGQAYLHYVKWWGTASSSTVERQCRQIIQITLGSQLHFMCCRSSKMMPDLRANDGNKVRCSKVERYCCSCRSSPAKVLVYCSRRPWKKVATN